MTSTNTVAREGGGEYLATCFLSYTEYRRTSKGVQRVRVSGGPRKGGSFFVHPADSAGLRRVSLCGTRAGEAVGKPAVS
jgi:hypothetical protein